MARQKKRSASGVLPIYAFGIVYALAALTSDMYELSGIVFALIAAAGASAIATVAVSKFAPKRSAEPAYAKPEPEKEPEKSYGPEIDAIIAEGWTAQKEMGRLYGSIKNAEVRAKINKIMEISDKIVQDAIHDPSDVPQIKRFLSYYLPTTIKLLNAYDRMGNQGIQGENISGSMRRIEDMLDAAIAAYEKQLDSLFANQALDIETDIQVMNSMIMREGLGAKDFKN